MKRYHFSDDSWWDQPACDCCYGHEEECYNIDEGAHPGLVQNGSSNSIEGCYVQVLEWEGVLEENWQCDDLSWEEEILYLEALMEKHKLQVCIDHNIVHP